MQYELVRSNRRTLAITIDGSGRCVVRAPMRMPMAEIKKIYRRKAQLDRKQAVRNRVKNRACPA